MSDDHDITNSSAINKINLEISEDLGIDPKPEIAFQGDEVEERQNDKHLDIDDQKFDEENNSRVGSVNAVPDKKESLHYAQLNSLKAHPLQQKTSIIDLIEKGVYRQDSNKVVFPSIPKKKLACAFTLFIIGTSALIIGIVSAVQTKNASKSIPYWLLGGFCGIPGFYFSFKFCYAMIATTADQRKNALKDVPR